MTLGPGCITDPFPLLRRRFPHGSQLLNFSLLSLVSILTLRFLSSFCSHIKISRWCKYCSRSGRGDGELRRHFSSSHFTSDTVPVSKDLRPLGAGYLVIWLFGVGVFQVQALALWVYGLPPSNKNVQEVGVALARKCCSPGKPLCTLTTSFIQIFLTFICHLFIRSPLPLPHVSKLKLYQGCGHPSTPGEVRERAALLALKAEQKLTLSSQLPLLQSYRGKWGGGATNPISIFLAT